VALTLDPSPRSEPEGLPPREALPVPRPASGLELAGRLDGSGYKEPPWLVRRADGQVLQLTPALYAVLEAVDGVRDLGAIRDEVRERRHLDIDPEDIGFLVTERLRPLGVLLEPDGSEPATRRVNPLLGLRGRVRAIDPERTDRIAGRFERLFQPLVVAAVTASFVASCWYVFATEGLGAALRDLFHQPGALLAVIGLTIVSAGFHEVGHAAACRYGGARPGVMGAGLYLVWPAFYTDVSDSYRLTRGGRLRVDLGGLYFNAVFAVATFAAWAGTRWDPLLVLFVLQPFQMARQLAPLLRFDGYHVLADLVGVPDLYARIGPVLRGLVPWARRPDTQALRPWARGVITLWVVLVAPILLFSLLVMVVMFPRLTATAAESIGDRWASLRDHWAGADLALLLLDALAIVAIALPVAGVAYLLVRVARRVARRAWRATDDNPRARRGLVLGAVALAVALGAVWWPQGQYRPINRGEQLTLPAITGWISDAVTGDLDLGADRATAAETLRPPSAVRSDVQEADAPSATSGPAGGHVFPAPPAPGEGDNQAVAIGYDDGQTVTDTASSLEWESSGAAIDNRNEAYALASCRGCRTTAVAFQVVLVVGQHSTQVPVNKAVALNEQCVLCTTRALAVQLVLPLDEAPDPDTRSELESIWSRTAGLDATLRSGGFAAARALVLDIEHDIATLLELDDDLAALTTTTTRGDSEVTAIAGQETTTTTIGSTSTTAGAETTTTSAPTTTTAAPTTTTTTTPSTTESTVPP
jgi:putative peptide zinc metalloprotease protein